MYQNNIEKRCKRFTIMILRRHPHHIMLYLRRVSGRQPYESNSTSEAAHGVNLQLLGSWI